MKSLILCLTFLSLTAFAQNSDTPIALVEGRYAGLKVVVLTADGLLYALATDGTVFNEQLPKEEFEKLSDEIKKFSLVEIRTTQSGRCDQLPPPAETLYDLSLAPYIDGKYLDTRLVLTQEGCYMKKLAYPAGESLLLDARALRQQLVDHALKLLPK